MRNKWFQSCGWVFRLGAALLLSACQIQAAAQPGSHPTEAAVQVVALPETATPERPRPSPFPTRPLYAPGELVDYTAQAGDTLPNLAMRFNTTVEEILAANAFIPASATTMPPGMPMKIPIYYLPLWGSPYRIIPDSLFVNGPAQVDFNTREFVAGYEGWLKGYIAYVSDASRSGAEIVDLVAKNYSVSPRLLLALLEYQAGALTQPALPAGLEAYPLGHRSWDRKGLFMQLAWAANTLNNGYYAYRNNRLNSIEYRDGRLARFDPWQNAATASLHNYFNRLYGDEDYAHASGEAGLALTYQTLFGDPWAADQPHIPGSLVQPEFGLPFEAGSVWAFTGGPHTGWGSGEPLAALDFAPPALIGGCNPTSEWATAVAAGVVARSEYGQVVLDLDGDGDERTGWIVYYLHVGTEGRVPQGVTVQKGDPIGHPSCEAGTSTGTHIHLARRYNGEWIPAEGLLAFNLEGWIAHNGRAPYLGTLTRFNQTITACQCSNRTSFIQIGMP